MTDKTIMALDPAALSAFAATLTNLPKDEISNRTRGQASINKLVADGR